MKIVIALDSFKGGMDAESACKAVAHGIRRADPRVECRLKPMADGGEGTASAIMASRSDGEWISCRVTGPLPDRQADAGFAWLAEDGIAVVEMAAASGLPLLKENERDPMRTTTYGTGELLQAAAEHGARQILLTIGGSATVDGGIGAAAAAGWQFLDKNGVALTPAGGSLTEIARIVGPKQNTLPPVTVLCDVTNPLTGERGAAAVYGPQKGATPAMVKTLAAGLRNLAERIEVDLGCSGIAELPGAGAAGGLGAGAVAFFNAELSPGVSTVIKANGLKEALSGADWCITGEGSFDDQSLDGKVVSGVAEAAREQQVPVVVFAGRVKADMSKCRKHGIQQAIATHAADMPMEEAIRRESEDLSDTATEWFNNLKGQTV
ncbi:MAG: glycerate kinase [Verrucomicrobiota bacterium]